MHQTMNTLKKNLALMETWQNGARFHDNDNLQLVEETTSPEINIKPKPFLRKGHGKLAYSIISSMSKRKSANTVSRRTQKSCEDNNKLMKNTPEKKPIEFESVTSERLIENHLELFKHLDMGSPELAKEYKESTDESADESDDTPIWATNDALNKSLSNKMNISEKANAPKPMQMDKSNNFPDWTGNSSFERSYNNKMKVAEMNCEIESKELHAFEILEERMKNDSFCSTSSSIMRLMEPSIKSTPKKYIAIPSEKTLCESDEEYYESTSNSKSNEDKESQFSKKIQDESMWDKSMSDSSEDSRYVAVSNHIKEDVHDNIPIPNKTCSNENIHDEIGKYAIHNCIGSKKCSNENSSIVTKKCSRKIINHMQKDEKNSLAGRIKYISENNPSKNCTDNNSDTREKELDLDCVSELTMYIKLLKKELKELVTQKDNYTRELKQIEKDKREMRDNMAKQKKQCEEFLKIEMDKFMKDKAVFEKHTKQLRSATTINQQSQEIKMLKDEVSLLKDLLSSNKASHSAQLASLRTQLRSAMSNNAELTNMNKLLTDELSKLKIKNQPAKKSFMNRRVNSGLSAINNIVEAACSAPQVTISKTSKDLCSGELIASNITKHNKLLTGYNAFQTIQDNDVTTYNSDINSSRNQQVDIDFSPIDPPKIFNTRKSCCYSTQTDKMPIKTETRKFNHTACHDFNYNTANNNIVIYDKGEVEIFSSGLAVHYFIDGSFKTNRPDGSTETIYPNGRIRIRNSKKYLLLDKIL